MYPQQHHLIPIILRGLLIDHNFPSNNGTWSSLLLLFIIVVALPRDRIWLVGVVKSVLQTDIKADPVSNVSVLLYFIFHKKSSFALQRQHFSHSILRWLANYNGVDLLMFVQP